MMAGRAEVLSAGDISNQCTCVDQIRRCLVLQTAVNSRAEFVLDTLRNVEPVKVSMLQMGQAAVVKVKDTCCSTAYMNQTKDQ